jgi:hypothetical protein
MPQPQIHKPMTIEQMSAWAKMPRTVAECAREQHDIDTRRSMVKRA